MLFYLTELALSSHIQRVSCNEKCKYWVWFLVEPKTWVIPPSVHPFSLLNILICYHISWKPKSNAYLPIKTHLWTGVCCYLCPTSEEQFLFLSLTLVFRITQMNVRTHLLEWDGDNNSNSKSSSNNWIDQKNENI